MRINFLSVLFLVLCCGRSQTFEVFEVKEGENFQVDCTFYTSLKWNFFCKNDCRKQEDILVRTLLVNQENGRYSIRLERHSIYSHMIVVSIRNVTLSDTGTYRCGLATFNGQTFEAFVDFIINVSSVVRSNPSPGVLSPETHSEPHEHHTPLSEVALYVGLSLSALLILSVTLTSLILYRRKRARTTPGAPDITINPQIQEMADSSSTLTYAEVDFSKCSSAPRCLTTTTEEAPVYSTVCLPHK